MARRRMYQLPERMVGSPDDLSGGIKIELVEKYINKHKSFLPRYRYLENLYKGFHDIYKQPEKESWKPDNRLAVNFPRYIVDTFLGYSYGIPIKKTHDDEDMMQSIAAFEAANEIEDHEYELAKRACIYGHAFEYLYQDENAKTRMTYFSPAEMFVVYDDTVRKHALFAVRYGHHSDTGIPFGEVLTAEERIPFDDGVLRAPEPNVYGRIPVVEWILNEERMGLFEAAAGMVEAYNHVLSEKGNDVDAFAEAYLAVLGAEIDEDGIYKIRDNRIINLYGTDDAKDILVQFLQKPTADGTQENLLNRLEKLIYQTSMVANISDETFGSSTSGVALAYKLQAMSNMAKTFDRKIEKSLSKRYKLFCSLRTNVPEHLTDAWQDIKVTMTRNLPKNLMEEAQTAAQLEGIVSHKTQLSVLSVVDNAADELERMQEEAQGEQSRFAVYDQQAEDEVNG